ncbi:MAG: hypothetical protein ACQETL_02695 [Bacteroidota bacterium]
MNIKTFWFTVMKLSNVIFLITLLNSFLCLNEIHSQSEKSLVKDSISEKSELRIGILYTSDYYFMGRSDSAKAPYLSPSVGYYHKSGLSIRSALSYLTTSGEGRVDLYTFTGGYDYYGRKFAAGISISQYFFNDLSYVVQAEMSTFVNVHGGYDFSAFMIFADVSLGFSEGTDVFLGAEINRTFYAIRNKLRITPAVYINAGSQKYYNEYYTMRNEQTGAGKGKGKGGTPQPIQNSQILESEKFQILDYEADVQVSYKMGKIRLFAATTWTFPKNPSTIVTDQGNYEEELKNGFYWNSGIRLTF